MPERLVRQRRGLVDLYRITSSQRAEHAAVFLLRRADLATLRHDVPGVALHRLSLWLREGLARRAGEDGEHRCWADAAPANSGAVLSLFLWSAMRGSVSHERLSACCALVGAPYGLLELKGNPPCPSLHAQMR